MLWSEHELTGKFIWSDSLDTLQQEGIVAALPVLGAAVDYLAKLSVLFGFLISAILQIKNIRRLEKVRLISLNKFSEGWSHEEASEYYSTLVPIDEDTVKYHFRHVELATYYARKHKLDMKAVRARGYVLDFSVVGTHKFSKATYQAALKACGMKHRRPLWNYYETITRHGKVATLFGKMLFADGNWADTIPLLDFEDNKDKWFLGQIRLYKMILMGSILAIAAVGIYLALEIIITSGGLANYINGTGNDDVLDIQDDVVL